MSNCSDFREEILDAELSQLRAEDDSPLAAHLRGCAECRVLADRILQGYAALNEGLEAVQPARAGVIPMRGHRRKWLSMPLAAAAVLALLMVPRTDNSELPRMDMITKLLFPEEAVVTPSAGQTAMVIEKPEMTIVWLYNEETR